MKYNQKPRNSGDAHPHDRICVLDIETYAPDFEGEGFPAWPLHQPICASVLTADHDPIGVVSFSLTTIMFPERETEAFSELELLLEGRTLVTYNGRGFDLPVLALTALKHRKFGASNLSNLWRANRYGAQHCDLADQFSQFGSARGASLATLCEALDISVKQNAHGDEVSKLYDSGEIETIKKYCEEDVAATYLLFLHWIAFRHADAELLVIGCAHLARFIEAEGLDHLMAHARYARTYWAHAELNKRMAAYLVRDLKIASSRNLPRPDLGIIEDDDDEDQIPF
jgi:DNA polymerase elongation subunit (family B)